MAKCPICGGPIRALAKVKTADDVICAICGSICQFVSETATADIKKYWGINHKRFEAFTKTRELSGVMVETITVDDTHQLFYIGKDKKLGFEPIIYTFFEIESCEIKRVGGKTVTKKKGGIARSIVGGAIAGPAGALVGATTAKEETKEVGGTNQLNIILATQAGEKNLVLQNVSSDVVNFFKYCAVANDAAKDANITEEIGISSADEIRKYKELMDEGIISQEEFEAKKKELLGL